MDLLRELDVTDVYVVTAFAGALMSVYWSVMMANDPTNEHIPKIYLFARRFFILCMGMGMVVSVWFGLMSSWTPWVTETIVNICIDGFLFFSILSSRIRMKTCSLCPFLPTTARHGWFRDLFGGLRSDRPSK